MEHPTITILDTFTIRKHGTVLCLRLDTDETLKIGDAVELLRPDGSVFSSRVKSFDMFLVNPPPPPGTRPVVGMMLTDDPGSVPSGSTLQPAP